jgi:hypothetical protein
VISLLRLIHFSRHLWGNTRRWGGGGQTPTQGLQGRHINVSTIGLKGFVGHQQDLLFTGLAVVWDAIQHHGDCASMLGVTGLTISDFLSHTNFESMNVPGVNGRPSAVTPIPGQGVVQGDPAAYTIRLYDSFWNLSAVQMATVLIHEMWHFRGGGAGDNDPTHVDYNNRDAHGDRHPVLRANCHTGVVN